MRDAVPLPGVTPGQVVSQLAHRLFGPLQPRRTQIVLDYHGLAGRPAGSPVDIARRHQVTAPTVRNNAAAIRAAGARQPLSPRIVTEVERPSTLVEDHLGRVRMASTLGLQAPEPPIRVELLPSHGDPTVAAPLVLVARTGVRILAAAGPLPVPVLTAGIARGRRFRDRNPLSDNDLAGTLQAAGCTVDPDGRWHPPAGAVPSRRDRLIVTRGAGRELSRQQMIDILLTAGYTPSSAAGRMSSSHPLFQRTGPDRYRIITADPIAFAPAVAIIGKGMSGG